LRLADRVVLVDGGRVAAQGSHEDLLVESARYRELLAGPGEVDGSGSDSIEVLAGGGSTAGDNGAADGSIDGDGTTPHLWNRVDGADTDGSRPFLQPATATPARPGAGGGAVGGGIGFGGGIPLSATPELLAKLEALPPADDDPEIDVVAEAEPDDSFSLRRFLRPYRRPLSIGFGLVVFDTLLVLSGPLLVRSGINRGVSEGSVKALLVASAAFLVVTLGDWVVVGATPQQMLDAG
jgi:ATP-binding cassette subfamily B protein